MQKSDDQKLQEMTQTTFPDGSYPVLYKSYWREELDDIYKVENNTEGVLVSVISEIYQTYYNLLLDPTTLTAITYDNTRNPYKIIFVLRYKVNGKELYMWEYYENWMAIKELNTTKWIQ